MLDAVEITGDMLFPGVGFVPRVLLRHDTTPFEMGASPPGGPFAVGEQGFGEHLVAVARQAGDVDMSNSDGPEAAGAGLVPQIGRLVRGSDENNLPWLDDLLSAIGRALTVLGAR